VRLVASVGAALLVALSASSPLWAAPTEPTDAERKEAKALANEGLALFGKGDYTGAVERLGRAEALVPLPTITLQRARALERLGRWVEAKGAFGIVVATDLPKTAPPVHKKAVADARKELSELEPRVPRLTVILQPAMRPDDTITIDGRLVTDPQEPYFELDPGEHVVDVARTDGGHARSTVTLAASEKRTIELSFATPAPKAPPPPSPSPGMPMLEIAGWIGVGVGGAALVVATATGVPAIGLAGDLEARCPNDRCPASAYDDLSEYDALRWTAGVTLIAGVLLAGAGSAAVLWSRTGDDRATPAKVEALLGPTALGARVTF
jgi:hypothetical protein